MRCACGSRVPLSGHFFELGAGHIDLAAQPLVDLARRRRLEEQSEGFGQILSGLIHSEPLACDSDLWAQSHVAVAVYGALANA